MQEPRTPRVVIAEDDEEMRNLICDLVARLDVEVDPAATGGELAIRLTDRRPVDLLVTDVRMPWMTGLQIAASARHAGLLMPIIVVTAFPDDELRTKVDQLGSAVLLAKPFSAEDLLALVRGRLFPARGTA